MSSVPSAGEDCDDLGEPPVALDTFELFEIDTWSDLDARPEGGASLEELLDPNASLQHEIVERHGNFDSEPVVVASTPQDPTGPAAHGERPVASFVRTSVGAYAPTHL